MLQKIIVLLTCLSITCFAAAQKLRYELDKNNGDTIYSYTSEERLYTKTGGKNAVADLLKSTIYKYKSGYSLALLIQTGRTNNFSISNGSEAILELADGTKVTASTRSDNRSRVSSLDYGCFMYCFYQLTGEAVRQLKSSPLTTISLQASNGEMYYEIKGKFSDVIADQLKKFQQ
jgi:hypothetical protein